MMGTFIYGNHLNTTLAKPFRWTYIGKPLLR